MFKLKFPSGAVVVFSHPKTVEFEGTLYVWPEDLDSLLEITQAEKERFNDNQMPRPIDDRDKSIR